jgi:hypothetical protein
VDLAGHVGQDRKGTNPSVVDKFSKKITFSANNVATFNV